MSKKNCRKKREMNSKNLLYYCGDILPPSKCSGYWAKGGGCLSHPQTNEEGNLEDRTPDSGLKVSKLW